MKQQQIKKPVIYNRITKRPVVTGEINNGKNLVIPGQDYTPTELMNQFNRGLPVNMIYVEGQASNFQSMNQIQKLEFIDELKTNQQVLKQQLKQQQLQHQLRQQEQLQADIANNTNATTINDDVKK